MVAYAHIDELHMVHLARLLLNKRLSVQDLQKLSLEFNFITHKLVSFLLYTILR